MPASMGRVIRLLGVAIVSALAAACGNSPTSPGMVAPNVTGTWVSSDRSFQWALTQSGTTVTGLHIYANGLSATPITGELTAREFSFSVITGERLLTFLDPPQMTDVGWGARVDVDGSRMTGSISSIGSPGRYYFKTITLHRVASDR